MGRKMKFPFLLKTCAASPKTLSFRNDDNAYMSLIISSDESAVAEGVRSDRLLFEAGETSSSSILEEAKACLDFPYKETASILSTDSRDPLVDFRASMEEMVEAHRLSDWQSLEELLACYLRINATTNHRYVIRAFVDLLLRRFADLDDGPSSSSSSSSSHLRRSFTSPLSFSSSSCCSSTVSLGNQEKNCGS